MLRKIKCLAALALVFTMTLSMTGFAFADGTAGNDAEGQTAFQGSPRIRYGAMALWQDSWGDDVYDGTTTKTMGPISKELKAIRATLENVSGGIEYRIYVNGIGWQEWKADGDPAAVSGENQYVEAIQVRLTGEISNFLDVWYSVSLSESGQLGWAKNGESCGTMGVNQYIKTIQMKLVAKIDPAPGDTQNRLVSLYKEGLQTVDGKLRYLYPDGTTFSGWVEVDGSRYFINDSYPAVGWQYLDGYKLYFAEDGKLLQNLEPVIGPQPSYLLKINKEMNCLTVYAQDGANGYIIPVRSMLCSTGDDTPLGTSKTNEKYRWHLMNGGVYTQYATRIIPGTGFMVHSVIYEKPDNHTLRTSTYNQLGIARSSGCIRLTSADSKWIYDNCKLGTTVTIYNDPIPGPYDRPTVTQIPGDQNWDPTDMTAQ